MVISAAGGIGGILRLGTPLGYGSVVGSASSTAAAADTRPQLRDLLADVGRLRRELVGLRKSSSLRGRGSRLQLVQQTVASSLSQGLQLMDTAATITSTEEVNATPTSFTPFGPAFAGGSTALATVDGVYDGSQGNDTLSFVAAKNAVVGGNPLRFDVLDGQGQRIETVDFGTSPPGTELSLSNGLVLSLSAGTVLKDDSFTVQVFADVGSVVDPDLSFDGLRNDNPNLEYGLSVTAGSFDVNGVTIEVYASDSLRNVLDRINASAAGVTAIFDAATETVRLTQDSLGSAHGILLENDSSGFLAASKLSTATVVAGLDDQRTVALERVASFADIASGTFLINSTEISIDVGVDSLQDVLDRINASSAGVTASFDPATQRVTLTSQTSGTNLRLEDGSSGFLTGVDIQPGNYAPEAAAGDAAHRTVSDRRAFLRALRAVGRALDRVFGEEYEGRAAASAASVRGRLSGVIAGAVEDLGRSARGDRLRTGLGIDFRLDASRRTLQVDDRRLTRTLARSPGDIERFLRGATGGDGGLVGGLEEAIESIETQIRDEIASLSASGLLVDLSA